jgi:hypothetical protein
VSNATAWRPVVGWLLAVVAGVIVVYIVLSEREPKGADPKWELAIRSGMPFVSAELVAAPPELSPSQEIVLQERLDALFQRTFLEPQGGDYLVLAIRGPQTWLEPRVPIDQWRAFHLVVSPTQKTVLRCYPRLGDMTWFDTDFHVESTQLEAGKWYQVRIFVRLFRQLTTSTLRAFRIDFVSAQPCGIRISDLYVEGER